MHFVKAMNDVGKNESPELISSEWRVELHGSCMATERTQHRVDKFSSKVHSSYLFVIEKKTNENSSDLAELIHYKQTVEQTMK